MMAISDLQMASQKSHLLQLHDSHASVDRDKEADKIFHMGKLPYLFSLAIYSTGKGVVIVLTIALLFYLIYVRPFPLKYGLFHSRNA